MNMDQNNAISITSVIRNKLTDSKWILTEGHQEEKNNVFVDIDYITKLNSSIFLFSAFLRLPSYQ